MKKLYLLIVYLLSWPLSASDVADQFSGSFDAQLDGRHYQLRINSINAAIHEGILQIDGEKLQVDARRFGDRFAGTIRGSGGSYGFIAYPGGAAPVFEIDDGRRIVFRRALAP